MKLTETERKLLEDAALLLSKLGASKASEEIDYVLEEYQSKAKLQDLSFKRKIIDLL
jgi:hypothetical protein